MTLFITYSLVPLALDGVTSFLQLLVVQNVRKNMHFGPTKVAGNPSTVQDGRIVINSEGFIHIFDLFEFRITIDSLWQ